MNDFEFEIPDLIGKVLPETNELKILSVIGYGSFAVVYKAEDIDGNLFAVKCIVKKGLNSFQLDLQYREAELLQSLENHPNIVNLYQVIDTEENLFFVLDLCECDLFEAIVHNHGFGNEYTKEVFEILIDTVQYLHDRNIYHRDLKPENILITADGDIKIADFGLACSDKWSKDFECGTLRYEPPECIDPSSKGYCPEKSDLWALGVILVNLRFERNPWAYASSEDNIYYEFSTNNSNILQQQLGLSNEMNNILKNIFKVDPNKRWSLSQLKEAIFDIDEMYDDSKYNPLPPKKSNYSSPIPITPNSRKGSKFTYNFSSTNSSTFNNSPRFVKQYEDNMESGYYVNDENEFTFHDKTYINSKYDDYFLNHHSLSHFSFCSRNEEEDDDYEEEEEEEEEIVDDEVLENDSEIEDENEEIKKRKGKPLFHCKLPRDIEIETFYLEDELCTTNDNRLYRSIKKGSICSRHSPSIRSNESCGSIRFLHDSKHAHKNKHIHRNDESHVIRPTPLRINTSLFYAEDETSSTVKVPEETKKQKSPEKFSSINKKISLEHEIPESWEDYSFDDVLSDIPLEDEEEKEFESKVKIESTPNPKSKLISKVEPEQHLKVVFPQLRKSPLKNSQTVSKDRVIMSKIYSDKIASFYKDQLIWSPRVTNREERDCEEEEKINELKLLPESVNSQPEEIKGSNPKEALNINVNCNSIVKKEEIKNFSFVSFYLGILKEKKNEISYYWKACSFFSKHALSVHFNEISLLNINLIWMSYQPTSYSFLMKYYIPQFPLYIFIFSYQLIKRIKKLPQYSLYPQNLEMEIMNKRNNKEIRKYYFQKPWNKNQLKTIVKAPFSFKTNKKEKRLIVRPNNNMLFRPMKMSKQLNHSILTFFNKILNIFIDLYEFSVNYKSTHYRPDIKIKTINILKTIVFNYQGIVNNTLHPISKDNNEYGFDYEKSVPYIPNQISPHMNSLVKLASNDLAIWTSMTSLENIFSFFVEKLNLSFLMMFISSFQSKFFLVSEISYKNFNFLKFTNNFIIFLNQFFSKCISIKN